MTLINSWYFTKTAFDAATFLKVTHNQYRLVSQRPYFSKKVAEDTGVALTLQIVVDDADYGLDKTTQAPRDNNALNTFDVTILNGQPRLDAVKGDIVRLGDFLPDKSFVIDFNVILRFGKVEVLHADKSKA
ncbi:hypothetical protein [Lacticaseibacillus saniviri]